MASNSEKLYFYSVRDKPYGCFSNFSPHGFHLDGFHWKTSEHYFQAQKFILDKSSFEKVLNATTPKTAASIGRDRSLPCRSDWESVKDDVMRNALLAKFNANPEIKEILLSTGDKILVEKSPTDYYWGCGSDMSGLNRLGVLLMETRSKLCNDHKN